MKKKSGFTLLEILIVLGIIAILLTMTLYLYPGLQKKAKDAERKAGLDTVRSALELYRSKNSTYPSSLSVLTQGTSKYLESIPQDPLPSQTYYYELVNGNDYLIGAKLEIPPKFDCTSQNKSCGSASCNYCIGPYGQK